MSNTKSIKIDIKNKIGVTSWRTDAHENAHITVKEDICSKCPHQKCISGCPTECFKFYDGKMVFQFEDCVECNLCEILCGEQESIEWHYPRGTYGVTYSQG